MSSSGGKNNQSICAPVLAYFDPQQRDDLGYNPAKKGRGNQHPLPAFAAELNMVVHACMRPLASAASTGFDPFFNHTLDMLLGGRIDLLGAWWIF